MTRYFDLVPGYESLATVYDSAIEQASEGKGRERHAEAGEPYENQIICEVARRVGLGYPLGQAVKKIYESQRIGGERGAAELLGALNYIAAAVIVMRERGESEGNSFQNGNSSPKAEADEGPKFKHGDKVQYRVELPSVSDWIWRDATYLRWAFSWQQDGEHIVTDEELGPVTVKDKDIRPAPKAEGCGYKKGDKVQCRVTLPSVSDHIWVDGEYVRYEEGRSRPHVVFINAALELVSDEDIRPALKAEGCEELVQKDAPQTREELYSKILESNPSTFGCAHKPTGEELAEMAEEEGKDA